MSCFNGFLFLLTLLTLVGGSLISPSPLCDELCRHQVRKGVDRKEREALVSCRVPCTTTIQSPPPKADFTGHEASYLSPPTPEITSFRARHTVSLPPSAPITEASLMPSSPPRCTPTGIEARHVQCVHVTGHHAAAQGQGLGVLQGSSGGLPAAQ